MKSTLKKLADKDKYPCLKIITGTVDSESYVILFSLPKTGMVVYSGDFAPYTVGHYSSSWVESAFENLPFGASVNIQV